MTREPLASLRGVSRTYRKGLVTALAAACFVGMTTMPEVRTCAMRQWRQ